MQNQLIQVAFPVWLSFQEEFPALQEALPQLSQMRPGGKEDVRAFLREEGRGDLVVDLSIAYRRFLELVDERVDGTDSRGAFGGIGAVVLPAPVFKLWVSLGGPDFDTFLRCAYTTPEWMGFTAGWLAMRDMAFLDEVVYLAYESEGGEGGEVNSALLGVCLTLFDSVVMAEANRLPVLPAFKTLGVAASPRNGDSLLMRFGRGVLGEVYPDAFCEAAGDVVETCGRLSILSISNRRGEEAACGGVELVEGVEALLRDGSSHGVFLAYSMCLRSGLHGPEVTRMADIAKSLSPGIAWLIAQKQVGGSNLSGGSDELLADAAMHGSVLARLEQLGGLLHSVGRDDPDEETAARVRRLVLDLKCLVGRRCGDKPAYGPAVARKFGIPTMPPSDVFAEMVKMAAESKSQLLVERISTCWAVSWSPLSVGSMGEWSPMREIESL